MQPHSDIEVFVVPFRNRSVITLIFGTWFLLFAPVAAYAGSVVVDPGHGGADPGAVGPTGYTEKAANLDISLRLRDLLRQNRYQVVMTRETDTAVSLERRVQIANGSGAKIFVSIHNNAAANSAAGGTETYYWSGVGPDSDSGRLARLIQEEVVSQIGLRSRGVMGANFYVLRGTNMPAVLFEGAFISNPVEEALLKTPSFRQKMAQGVYNGIRRFIGPTTLSEPRAINRRINPKSRIEIDLGNFFYANTSLGMRITSDRRVVAERSGSFNAGGMTGGSTTIGTTKPGRNWFLAEGGTAAGFNTWILLVNPRSRATTARITYMTGSGVVDGGTVRVPALSRRTVNVNAAVPNRNMVSTRVTAQDPIVVERSVYFASSRRQGGHTAIGAKGLSRTWYFAEGMTGGGFDTRLHLFNPSGRRVKARITYLTPAGEVSGPEVSIPARRRRSIRVSNQLPNAEAGAIITADSGIIAERTTYFDYNGATGAHATGGARRTSRRWLFAEGSTREGFASFLAVQNPGNSTATVAIEYMQANGTVINRQTTVAPRSRQTLDLAGPDQAGPGLNFAVRLISDAPIVAERSVYFTDGSHRGGHGTIGARQGSKRWLFAEGFTGRGFKNRLVVNNPTAGRANVRIEFFRQ
jgi:N-acetylmuramoyl-L-alanine amidase